MKRRDFLRLTLGCAGAAALDSKFLPNILHAKELYPAGRITWISHTQPGGGFDILPRAMAPFMSKYLKEMSPGCKGGDVMIKNEPAAAGLKAYTAIFKAEPDGYTVGGMDISFITDLVTEKMEFDVMKYTYLCRLGTNTKLVVTSRNGFKSWDEAVENSKKGPLKIGVGQFGRGNHVAGILLKEALGLNARFINTQSTAGNMSMVMRGDVQVGIASEDSISNVLQAKEVNVLLTYGDAQEYPGAVSLKKLGHGQVGEYASIHRFAIAPPGLPKELTTLLMDAIRKTVADKEFLDWANRSKFYFTPVYGEAAAEIARGYIQFYKSMEATFKKYL